MLQNIRDNSQGWIAKTIIGVIVVLMALTGFDAIFKATSHSNDAAKVNGDEISQNELSQAVDMQRRQLMQQLGKDFDASLLDEKMLRESALKGLIDRKLLLQGAQWGAALIHIGAHLAGSLLATLAGIATVRALSSIG